MRYEIYDAPAGYEWREYSPTLLERLVHGMGVVWYLEQTHTARRDSARLDKQELEDNDDV